MTTAHVQNIVHQVIVLYHLRKQFRLHQMKNTKLEDALIFRKHF